MLIVDTFSVVLHLLTGQCICFYIPNDFHPDNTQPAIFLQSCIVLLMCQCVGHMTSCILAAHSHNMVQSLTSSFVIVVFIKFVFLLFHFVLFYFPLVVLSIVVISYCMFTKIVRKTEEKKKSLLHLKRIHKLMQSKWGKKCNLTCHKWEEVPERTKEIEKYYY